MPEVKVLDSKDNRLPTDADPDQVQVPEGDKRSVPENKVLKDPRRHDHFKGKGKNLIVKAKQKQIDHWAYTIKATTVTKAIETFKTLTIPAIRRQRRTQQDHSRPAPTP